MSAGNIVAEIAGRHAREAAIGQSQSFALNQASTIDLTLSGSLIRSILVDNPTPAFIHFLQQTGAGSWVLPFTFNAVVRSPAISKGPIRVTTKDVPTGWPPTPPSTLAATLTVTDQEFPSSPGFPNAAPIVQPTYRAAASFVAATGATDAVIINSSSTKIVRVTRFTVAAVQVGASGTLAVTLLKRAVLLDSGGTLNQLTSTQLDSNDPAATAAAYFYTVNPNLGTFVGNVGIGAIFAGLVTAQGTVQVWDFGRAATSRPLVLRNNPEQLALSFLGATAANTSVYVEIEWAEDAPI